MAVDILIINSEILLYNLYATSVAKSLKKKYGSDARIFWLSSSSNLKCLKFNTSIDQFLSYDDGVHLFQCYDIVLNFNFSTDVINSVNTKEKFGIGCENEGIYRNVLSGEKKVNSNLYQVFFRLSKMTWKGEGIDLGYNPGRKQVKGNIGYYLSNAVAQETLIREFTGLNGSFTKIKKCGNILKQMNILNKYEAVITDDLLIQLLSSSLRKEVYFLKTFPVNHKIEFFNNGRFFNVPNNWFLLNGGD